MESDLGGRGGGHVTYSCLGCDVGAAHYVGPCQRFLPLGSLPQRDEGRHVCGGTQRVSGVRPDAKGQPPTARRNTLNT